MCYAQEGYVHSSDSDSLGFEQLKTVFYCLSAMGFIGFAVGIVENIVKSVSASRNSLFGFAIGICENAMNRTSMSSSSETLENSSASFKGKNPILCHKCSSIMLILNQVDSESELTLQLKNLIFSENCDIKDENR